MTEIRQVVPGTGALVWSFGPVQFDEAALVLTVAGRPVPLERRPLELLLLLLRHAGEVVTKEELLDALWPDRIVTEASLTKCLSRLRQALGDADQKLIRTVHGYGYRLAADVRVSGSSHPAPRPAAVDLAPDTAVPHRPGWRLRQRLATGGFGDVWLAEIVGGAERRVFKFAEDSARLAALRREIAVSRLLRAGLGPRDDIARVLAANLEEPPYFLETEWSAEGNLAQFLAACGGAAALSMETRLALVAEIAEALAAAHGMGVLHRDLKPGNVLIWRDAAGEPRIRLADFGSGRVLDPAQLDAFGITRLPTVEETDSSFTLPYRAPELLAGRTPTVQGDIFALGVVLFQLVVGDLAAPLAPGWESRVADPLLRQDIAAACDGDPTRRLGSAAVLAERLRHLPERRRQAAAQASVAAEQARLREAAARAAARRGPLLALVASLVLGLIASLGFSWRADRARHAARAEAARAEAVTGFLTRDLLSAANPFLASNPNVTVKEVLTAAALSFDRRFPGVTADRAVIEEAIGRAYAGFSDPKALPLLQAALETSRQVDGDAAAPTQRIRLDIADYYDRREESERAIAAAQRVLDVGAGAISAADELRARAYIATNRCNLDPAEQACIAPIRSLLAEARSRLGAAHDVTMTLESNLAFNLAQAQHFPEALALAHDALARSEANFGRGTLYVQDARYALAQVLVESGDTAQAIALFTSIRATLLEAAGHEDAATMRAANQLGRAYYAAGRFGEALPLFRSVAEYSQRTGGENAVGTRSAWNNIANVLLQLGRANEALPIQTNVLAVERRVGGANNPQTLWCENALAKIQDKTGDRAAAMTTYDDLLWRARGAFTHGEWDLAAFEANAARVQAEQGNKDAARALLTDSVQRFTAALGSDHTRTRDAKAALEALK